VDYCIVEQMCTWDLL